MCGRSHGGGGGAGGRGEKRLEGEGWGVRQELADSQNTMHATLT